MFNLDTIPFRTLSLKVTKASTFGGGSTVSSACRTLTRQTACFVQHLIMFSCGTSFHTGHECTSTSHVTVSPTAKDKQHLHTLNPPLTSHGEGHWISCCGTMSAPLGAQTPMQIAHSNMIKAITRSRFKNTNIGVSSPPHLKLYPSKTCRLSSLKPTQTNKTK